LPSDLEQKLGIRPNSGSDYERGRRPLPSDVEQKLGLRPNSNTDQRSHERGGRSSGWQDFGAGARRSNDDGPRRYGYEERWSPQEACERQAYRQGLYGSELRRYMRWCLSRG
jgi:hypothetical protein